jgi:hypothetical protein
VQLGLFKKLRRFGGTPPLELMENGRLARGVILSIESTPLSTGPEGASIPICKFLVEVTLDNTPPYEVECRQAISYEALGRLVPKQTMVAVRVDPNDPNEIAIDLNTPPPTVTVQREGGGAAEVIARGVPVRAVIVAAQPMGMRNSEGVDIHAFVLTVLQDGRAPREARVANPVPPDARPLLVVGANLPAKARPEEPEGVVIDWRAARAEFAGRFRSPDTGIQHLL